MLDFITLAVQPFVKIRKEEWSKTLLMFFYFFITITCLYILKPVRSSIFLEKSGFENLPYVWISTVLILMGVVAIYVKFVGWLQKNVLLMGTVLFFVSNIFGFWWLLGKDVPGLPAAFYIWVSIFSIMNVTQFWTLANDIFNPREAKRLFGFIGSGGILGGMCGGYITGLLVHTVGTVNLLIIAAAILICSVIIIQIIWKGEHFKKEIKPQHDEEIDDQAVKDEKNKQSKEVLRNIWRSKYLLLLLTMVCLAKLVSTLIEYQFNGIVQGSFLGIDKKTAFFGWFWGMLNTVSFIIQFFLTSRVLRHLGIRVALLILPIGLLFGNMAILLNPTLWSAVFTMMYDGSMNYSLNQASKEVLYLPIAREIRYRVKPFIDMVGYRTAKGIGSLLILFMTQVLVFDLKSLSIFTLALIVVWILAALVMKKGYLGELRNLIVRERGEVQPIAIQSSDDALFNSIIDALSSSPIKSRFLALRSLNIVFNSDINELLKTFSPAGIQDFRNKAKDYFFEEYPEASEIAEIKYRKELREILSRGGLENFQEYASFISSFRSAEEVASIRIFLGSRLWEVQRAAFLLLIMFDKEFDYQRLPEMFRHSLKSEFIPKKVSVEAALLPVRPHDFSLKMEQIRKKLIGYLDTRDGEKALEVIEEFLRDEEDFMKVVDEFLTREKLPESAVKKLVKILSMIPRQKSVEILQKSLFSQDGEKRNSIIEAMSKMRLENPGLDFDESILLAEINAEAKEYGKALRLLGIYLWRQGKSFSQAQAEGDAFQRAQESRLTEIVQRLFLLLLLLSEPEDIRTAYTGFLHPSDYVRANALELLDNLLTPRLRHPVLSLLDGDDSLPRIREKGIKDFHWNDERANVYLKKTVTATDLWSSISSVVLMAKCRMNAVLSECLTKEQYSNPAVREALILIQTHSAQKV